MIASKSCITKDSYEINDIVWLKDTKTLINRDTLLVVCLNRSFSENSIFFKTCCVSRKGSPEIRTKFV